MLRQSSIHQMRQNLYYDNYKSYCNKLAILGESQAKDVKGLVLMTLY